MQWLSGFIEARVDHYFEFTVAGEVSVHSMALVHTQDCHGLFDPDFGMASIPGEEIDSALRFCQFLENYLYRFYGECQFVTHCLTAFKSKKQSRASMRLE